MRKWTLCSTEFSQNRLRMKEAAVDTATVFRDDDGDYVIRAGGHWRRCATRDEALQFLTDTGHRPEADVLLCYAT